MIVLGGVIRVEVPCTSQWFISLHIRHWTSESDVHRRQILTSKVDPRAVRVSDCSWSSNSCGGGHAAATGSSRSLVEILPFIYKVIILL